MTINFKAIFVAILVFSLPHLSSAQNIPSPTNRNCTSPVSCRENATLLFSEILKDAEELSKKDNILGIGEICFRLGQIRSNYFQLKQVDFNVLPLSAQDRNETFNKLYQIGEINILSLNFCGLQKGNNKGDLNYISSYIKNVKNDANKALDLLKTQSAVSTIKPKPAAH